MTTQTRHTKCNQQAIHWQTTQQLHSSSTLAGRLQRSLTPPSVCCWLSEKRNSDLVPRCEKLIYVPLRILSLLPQPTSLPLWLWCWITSANLRGAQVWNPYMLNLNFDGIFRVKLKVPVSVFILASDELSSEKHIDFREKYHTVIVSDQHVSVFLWDFWHHLFVFLTWCQDKTHCVLYNLLLFI